MVATTRTSTSTSRVLPTARTCQVSSTRRSVGWSGSGISATSSSSSVPPRADRKRPGWSWTAPVKAPRTCPNSSLASSPSVNAPQLTATNGPGRPLRRWIWRATISLPVPVSPVTTTVRRCGATASMLCRMAAMEGLTPVSSGSSPARPSPSSPSAEREYTSSVSPRRSTSPRTSLCRSCRRSPLSPVPAAVPRSLTTAFPLSKRISACWSDICGLSNGASNTEPPRPRSRPSREIPPALRRAVAVARERQQERSVQLRIRCGCGELGVPLRHAILQARRSGPRWW